MNNNNIVVLTGAGFAHPFGGFLSEDMWSCTFNKPAITESHILRPIVFNHVKKDNDYDYEDLYHEIIESNSIDMKEKIIVREAFEWVYEQQDISNILWETREVKLASGGTRDCIWNFVNNVNASVIFTLNQDLFIERNIGFKSPVNDEWSKLVGKIGNLFVDQSRRQPLSVKDFVQLPPVYSQATLITEIEKNKKRKEISYIKLHGSYGWLSSKGEKVLVIGKNKEQQLRKEPMLDCYYDYFKDELAKDRTRLIIIGYSFRDTDINKIILDAVKRESDEKKRLKVYIINPARRSSIRANTCLFAGSEAIWSHVYGYFPVSITDVIKNKASNHICDQLQLLISS